MDSRNEKLTPDQEEKVFESPQSEEDPPPRQLFRCRGTAQFVEARFRGSISRARTLIQFCEVLLELVRLLIEGVAKGLTESLF